MSAPLPIGPAWIHEPKWDGHRTLVGDRQATHAFAVFDLLAEGGRDLTTEPWQQRRQLLERLVQPGPRLMLTPTTDDGASLWEATLAQGYEGIVSKHVGSRYLPGRRSPSWVRTKHRHVQELVIGGYLAGSGWRSDLGSLLLGVHDPAGGPLRFSGAVGSGIGAVDAAQVVRET